MGVSPGKIVRNLWFLIDKPSIDCQASPSSRLLMLVGIPEVDVFEHSQRRMKPVEGGRPHRYELHLSEVENEAIRARALQHGVTLQRYLVESALGAPTISSKTVLRELAGVRRIVAGEANNINQIAHAANVGSMPEPEELDAIRVAVEEQLRLLQERFGELG